MTISVPKLSISSQILVGKCVKLDMSLVLQAVQLTSFEEGLFKRLTKNMRRSQPSHMRLTEVFCPVVLEISKFCEKSIMNVSSLSSCHSAEGFFAWNAFSMMTLISGGYELNDPSGF